MSNRFPKKKCLTAADRAAGEKHLSELKAMLADTPEPSPSDRDGRAFNILKAFVAFQIKAREDRAAGGVA